MYVNYISIFKIPGWYNSCLENARKIWSVNSSVCVCVCVRACTKSHQSSPTLCDLMACRPAGSSVHGILWARILELVAMPSSRGSSQPRDGTPVSYISCIGRQVLYHYCHLGSLNSNAGEFKVSNISKHSKEKKKKEWKSNKVRDMWDTVT